MINLGRISSTDPIVDKKVKFFHDYFHYYLLDGAKKIDGFPENHLSYLEKILVRLESLTKMQPSIRKVIALLLEENEFDTIKDEFSKKKEVKPLVISLKSQIKNTKSFDLNRFKDDCNKIVNLVNGTEGLLGKQYFSDLLKLQISILRGPLELDHHKSEIIRNSRWMVAEYIRHGFDEKELSGLDGIFRRLVKFGQLKDKEKASKVDFPLPLELKTIKNSPNFEAELEKYLGGNQFELQFQGMLNALNEIHTADLYFRIGDVEIGEKTNFFFQYNNVLFITKDKIPLETLNAEDYLLKDIKNHFSFENIIIAKITCEFKSASKATENAKLSISKSLDALNYIIDKDGGKILIDKILFIYPNRGFRWNSSLQKKLEIGERDMNFIQSCNNTIPEPDNISNENQKYLERCNIILFKGLSCKKPDDIITCFWQYWESAFCFYLDKKGEKIIQDLSLIIAKGKSKDMKIELGFLLYNYAMNNCESNTFGISPDFYMKNRIKNQDEDIEDIVNEIKGSTTYPFLVNLVDRYYSIDESEDIKWHRFYTKLFWQLYEQRNSIHHNATYCDITLDQLKFFFRTTCIRWQNKLFTEMGLTPELGMEEIIINLKSKSLM